MKKIIKKLLDVLCIGLILCFIFFVFSSFKARRNPEHIPGIWGYRPMLVLSGSMSPAIEAGDMIIAKTIKPRDIALGDVITYKINQDTLVTHRVIEIIDDKGKLMFKTKGDANNVDDQSLVAEDQIVGSLGMKIPYGGHLAEFVRKPIGFVLFVILPGMTLLGIELKNILFQLKNGKQQEHKNS